MSKHNTPRIPVRFVSGNKELIKSMGADYSDVKGHTDYVNDVDADVHIAAMGPVNNYRTPADRVNGNEMFRRYLDGRLDIKYAVDKVVDAVHRYKEKDIALYTQEAVSLQILFPGAGFDGGVDPAMANAVAGVNLKLTPQEIALIRFRVASHLAEEMNYNAGQGGGSVPGRNQTYRP